MRTIQSELKRTKISGPVKRAPKLKKRQKQLSQKELEELMGMRMPIYTRHKGGAMRRKR